MEEQYDLAKWLSGEMTKSELDAFQKSPDFETYNKIKNISSELEVSEFNSQEVYQNIKNRKKKKKVVRLQDLWYMKVAAILVIALGLTLLAKPYISSTEYALAGARKTFLLPDNSEIVLNSGSEIQYKKWNWDKDRSLNLKGEAFFKVAKGEKFTVKTELGTVTVVGTKFNIKSIGENFEVECYEGKVKVAFAEKTLFLTKGENVVVQKNNKIEALPLTNSQPSWMENEIKFNSNSLQEIIDEIEIQYNVNIKNTANSNQSFTGTVPLNDLDAALQIISKTYQLNYKKTYKEIIISAK